MSDTKVGVLIDKSAQRDAIHIAVAPVIAGEDLDIGQSIGLEADGTATSIADKLIGIVDPFLRNPVLKGERFWLFLCPQTVTGMRHHWKHPEFSEEDSSNVKEFRDKKHSELFLRQYAEENSPYSLSEDAFINLISGLKTGELFFHGNDLHGFEDLPNSEELRKHAENYLGIKIAPWGDFRFSCSC